MFKVGDEVEAKSPDNSLKETLFPAKIVGRAGESNNNTFVVEYKTLEEGSEPFREEVDVKLLRPLPPPDLDYTFKSGDVVQAFFTGAWWKGTVTNVDKDSGILLVYFGFAKEEFGFLPAELRLHREWIDGSWLLPVQEQDQDDQQVSVKVKANSSKRRIKEKTYPKKKQRIKAEKFSKGTLIEVRSDEEGFEGAWFAASIINAIGQEKYLVEYQSLRTDDETQLLREEVDIQHVRPYPPDTVVVDGFNLNDQVDAFYNDGWWEGVISKIQRGSRYKVFFKATNDEWEFQHSDLRLRQDWVDGTWVLASKILLKVD